MTFQYFNYRYFTRLGLILIFLFSISFVSCSHSGAVKIEENYPDGKLKISYLLDTTQRKHDTLVKTEYYPNGKVKIKGSYENNVRQGVWEYYYNNGNLWSKGQFVKGKSHGAFTIYNEDGSLFMQSSYKNGVPDGKWSFYEKGKKIRDVTFKNDSIISQTNY